MKRILHFFTFLPFCTAMAVQALAADSAGQYQTLYYVSCENYVAHRKEPLNTGNNAVDKIYVSGWLSGYNYLTPNTFNIVSKQNVDGVMEWLDRYCAKNPTRSLEAALLQLTDDLYPSRVQEHPAAEKAAHKKKSK